MTNPYLEKTNISLSPHPFLFSLSAYLICFCPPQKEGGIQVKREVRDRRTEKEEGVRDGRVSKIDSRAKWSW